MHVRAHERAVRVIVFKERNERCGNRNQLLWRHVHIVDLFDRNDDDIACVTNDHEIVGQLAILVDRHVGLRHIVLRLFHRRHIDDFFRELAVLELAIRRLDEAVFIDASKSGERVDQTDIRAFRRFNRADTTVMRWMHVADFEACAFTRQTTRSKRR